MGNLSFAVAMLREGERVDGEWDLVAAHVRVNGGVDLGEVGFDIAHGDRVVDRRTETAGSNFADDLAVGIGEHGAVADRLAALRLEADAKALRAAGNGRAE